MTISRRQLLGTMGTSVIATGTAACARANEQQAPTPATPVTRAAALPPTEFRLVFGGLQLFVIDQSAKRIVVAMPKVPPTITAHKAQLGILGGEVTSSTAGVVHSAQLPFGIKTHGISLDDYRVRFSGTGTGAAVTFDDSAPRTTAPGSADDWKSLRHIPDFALIEPGATLKQGWDTTLPRSIVEITSGELAALPGYDTPSQGNTVFKGQYFTHFSTLRLPSNGTVTITLDSLIGQPSATVNVKADNTGPLIGFLAYAPISGGGKVDHGLSIYELFNPTGTVHSQQVTPALPPSSAPPKPPISLSQASFFAGFEPLAHILTDGTPSCPPFSFRA